MLTSAGARTLRGIVRVSHGFLQRRRPLFCRNDKAFLRTSSLGHTTSSIFVKDLCTRLEVGSTRKLSNGNNTEDVELARCVETRQETLCEGNNEKIAEDSQNRQGENLFSGEKKSYFCSSNICSNETPSNSNSDSKKDLDFAKNIDNISENQYPISDSPRFQLPVDWKQSKETSPGIKFQGDIYVIKNYKDEIEHKEILEQFLDEDVLGFDTEHCPVEHQVCVVQLASQDKAVLWQCMNFKRKISPYLKEILTGKVAKVGHACVDDAIMISNQFNIEPVNLIDTYCWARDLRCSHKSLQGVCAIFLNEFLSKKHQRSDWKKAILSPGQIRYAATDAWVSLRVYQEMKRHGEELGVTLTPIYENLQKWQAEVKDNQRRRRKRRRERIKERKQELLSQIESVKQKQNEENSKENENNEAAIKQASNPEELNKRNNIENTALEPECEGKVSIANKVGSSQTDNIHSERDEQLSDDVRDSNGKQSKGSKRRLNKFLAKFHPLE
ncbi:uncharacterized protein LOC116304230 [Actinia tenebrosa]|uniref:Uncharacterized protein LOC116304230 n=1 Tax=Actinia tenebrosa TaxID=6105 RepID=A0A6P8IS41_ACTTE|nr:uncharacterized protein LOC116304230 [Actinia tenebrosa]